jgi:hypothetical protein
MFKIIKIIFEPNHEQKNLKGNLVYLFYSLFYAFFCLFFFILIVVLFYEFINYIFETKLSFNEISNTDKNIKINNPFYMIAILGPIIEEVLFRLWLSFKKNDIVISIIFWFFACVNGSFVELTISISEIILLILFSLIIIKIINLYFENIKFIFSLYRVQIYFISMFSFAIFHLSNFDVLNLTVLILSPLYLFPKFIIGFFITKLRVEIGFMWGLFFHMIVNSLSFLIST